MADTYAKFDGVDGESKQDGAVDWIEIMSVGLSAYAPDSADAGGGEGVGKPTYSPVSLMTIAGKHTPLIKKKFHDGKHFDKVEIQYLKQASEGPAKWYRYITFKHCFITGIGDSKSDGSLANENITFKFEEIEEKYKIQGSDGTLENAGTNTYNNKTNVSS